ncbi:MAG: hypothetical protein A2Y17_06690 [Clostridiales bacterium GWF2_38_85]|nr:MAG: hypothetical protein A2Y17_06690 [Clostridiales bacterium GWF2_38_85]
MNYLYVLIPLFILILLYLICIKPSSHGKQKCTPLMGWFYAHRGLHENASPFNSPENSLEAFKRAINSGYGIELDVQLTKDKKVVVFHDDNLSRICGIDKAISDFTYDELRQFRLLSSNCIIPLFNDVLQLINGKVPLIVEIKAPSKADEISIYTVKILDTYKGIYCIESFNPLSVAWFCKNRPDIIRGQLCDKFWNFPEYRGKLLYLILQNMMFNIIAKPHFIAFNIKNKNSIPYRIIKFLYKPCTVAWAVRSDDDYINNKDEFDLIIFENIQPGVTK